MNSLRLLTCACALAALPLWAAAQAASGAALPELPAASAAGPVASGPGPRNPPQRLRSPAEVGSRATAPGDLKPERPVAAPQISIPFGKKAPPPTPREEGVVRRGTPTSAGGVDDAAARCEAQPDSQARADCRAKAAREAKNQLPN